MFLKTFEVQTDIGSKVLCDVGDSTARDNFWSARSLLILALSCAKARLGLRSIDATSSKVFNQYQALAGMSCMRNRSNREQGVSHYSSVGGEAASRQITQLSKECRIHK